MAGIPAAKDLSFTRLEHAYPVPARALGIVESCVGMVDEEPDILCEGHFGIIRPASEVRNYIEDYLRDYGK